MASIENSRLQTAGRQALYWFVRSRSGEMTEQEQSECEGWLASDEVNRRAYERINGTWCELEGLAARPFPELEQAEAYWESKAVALSIRSGQRMMVKMKIVGAMAASLALLLVTAWWWTMIRVETSEYRTVRGEQRTITLSDGSTIAMNTDSALTVYFSGRTRTVVLEKGEALFTVAHEPARPFEVVAGNGRMRDIGTAFVVHHRTDDVTVTVVDGLVDVAAHRSHDPVAQPQHSVLTKGTRARYTPDGRLWPAEPAGPETELAWLHGKLVFEARPLKEVIQEVARYRVGEIRLLGPQLAALKVSGVFHIEDLGGFLTALEDALPVKVAHVTAQLVIIESDSTLRRNESH